MMSSRLRLNDVTKKLPTDRPVACSAALAALLLLLRGKGHLNYSVEV
jgi:hypothetical protein